MFLLERLLTRTAFTLKIPPRVMRLVANADIPVPAGVGFFAVAATHPPPNLMQNFFFNRGFIFPTGMGYLCLRR